MLLGMIIMFAIPVVIVVALLFVTSRSARRNICYLSATFVASIVVLVIAWMVWPDDWGFWMFFVLPTTFVTGLRLIVAAVVGPPNSADAPPWVRDAGRNGSTPGLS